MTDLNYNCEFQENNFSCFDNFLDNLIIINYQAIRFLNTLFCISVKNDDVENVENVENDEKEVQKEPELVKEVELEEFKKEEITVVIKEIEDLHGFIIIEDSKQD